MTTGTAGEFFDRFADTFDSLYDGKRSPLQQAFDRRFRRDIVERFRLTFHRLGELEDRSVLDVGCGSGVYMREALARNAARVVGVDSAPRMLELARVRLMGASTPERFELLPGVFPAVSPTGPFDGAIAMGVMDYVDSPVVFLGAIARLMRVGGMICVSFPSWHWFRSPIRELRYRLRKCPLRIYQRDQVVRVVSAAGLEILALEKISGAGQDFHLTASVRVGAH